MSSTDNSGKKLSNKIDFLIIGSAKAGSNSLHRYVASHPEIYMPEGVGRWEEINVFLKPGNQEIKDITSSFLREDKSNEHILDEIFDEHGNQPVTGIRSTDYSKAPHRDVDFDFIKEHNPDMKFLFAIRDPYQKLMSQYRHFRRNRPAFTEEDFVQEVSENDYYQYASSYAYQAEQWYQHFDKSQLHFVVTEQLREAPQTALNSVFEHLEVSPFEVPEETLSQQHNVGGDEDNLTVDDIPQRIRQAIKEDREKLQVLVNLDLDEYWSD